jgi:hypothetical protein
MATDKIEITDSRFTTMLPGVPERFNVPQVVWALVSEDSLSIGIAIPI